MSCDQTDVGDTMVIYFSVTGHTKGVAEMIAQITDADLYEIVPEALPKMMCAAGSIVCSKQKEEKT